MKQVKFTIMMDVTDSKAEALKVLEHHADFILDLDSYPEIKRVYDCHVDIVEKEGT